MVLKLLRLVMLLQGQGYADELDNSDCLVYSGRGEQAAWSEGRKRQLGLKNIVTIKLSEGYSRI